MEIMPILPFIAPMIVMQTLVQAYFIRHCYQNDALSKRAKILVIAAIAVFNTPAAAVYLFLSRPKETVLAEESRDTGMDDNIRQGTFILLTLAYQVFSLRILVITDTPSHDPTVIWLVTVCYVVFILQGLAAGRHPALSVVLPLMQIALVTAIDTLDGTQGSQFLVLAVVAGIINACPLRLARFHSALAFSAYLSENILKTLTSGAPSSLDSTVGTLYMNTLLFAMVYIAFYMLRKQSIANRLLKEQSLKLEEMAALRERSRITGEIHDTVGHTLTSAAIAIEVGEKLLDQDISIAREKFTLAGEQVRKGLLDIRQSVKTIQEGMDKPFPEALVAWAEGVGKRTGLAVHIVTEMRAPLLPIQQKVLLHAATECATNSLKHGHATAADLLIQEYRGTVTMTYTDNGTGTDQIVFGFGLDNMARQAESIGGTLSASSEKGEGFTISITIPTGSAPGGDKS